METLRKITCPCDLQGRKAIKLVQTVSSELREQIYFQKGLHRININSLLGVLSLGIKEGEEITIITKTAIGMEVVIRILESLR